MLEMPNLYILILSLIHALNYYLLHRDTSDNNNTLNICTIFNTTKYAHPLDRISHHDLAALTNQ